LQPFGRGALEDSAALRKCSDVRPGRPIAALRPEDTMPRLFTALEIPPEVAVSLSMLRGGLPGARWIDPENYHLSLRFIGDVDDTLAHEIASLLDQINRPTFELRFDRLDSFGGRRPRAVIAAAAPIAPLIELQAELERLMQRMGLEPEGRKFTPHVTLARLRDSSSRQVANYLSTRAAMFVAPFLVTRFVLLSSRPAVGGGPFLTEAVYPLNERNLISTPKSPAGFADGRG
jgi:2'-5' RNA ligase